MARRIVPALIALMLAGCAATCEPVVKIETVYVDRPISAPAQAPAELAASYSPVELPVFIKPSDAGAAAALDEKGLNSLREILRTLTARDKAWSAWAEKLSGTAQ